MALCLRGLSCALALQLIACSGSDSSGTQRGAGGETGTGGTVQSGGASAGGASDGGMGEGGASAGAKGAGGLTNGAGTSGTGGLGAGGLKNGAGGSGTGGLGAGGSAAMAPCPAAPPVAKSACNNAPGACYYEDCAGFGRVSAQCANGLWVLDTGACRSSMCGPGSTMCSVGQACVQTGGGAVFTECKATRCNGGLVRCDCVDGCTPGCFVTGSVYSGIS